MAKSMSCAAALAHRPEIVEGPVAHGLLQAVDAAEPAIVEDDDIELDAHHDGGRDLGIHHEIAAIAHQHDNPPLGKSELHPQPAGDLIAHAGIAVFQVIALGRAGAPELVQLARQAAGRRHHDVGIARLAVDGTQAHGLRAGHCLGGMVTRSTTRCHSALGFGRFVQAAGAASRRAHRQAASPRGHRR
jgi:hypothetical protein